MLFSNTRLHSLYIPSADDEGRPATIKSLIDFLCRQTMTDSREELFVLDGHLYVSTFPPSLLPGVADHPHEGKTDGAGH